MHETVKPTVIRIIHIPSQLLSIASRVMSEIYWLFYSNPFICVFPNVLKGHTFCRWKCMKIHATGCSSRTYNVQNCPLCHIGPILKIYKDPIVFLSRNVASGRESHPYVTKYSNILRPEEEKEHSIDHPNPFQLDALAWYICWIPHCNVNNSLDHPNWILLFEQIFFSIFLQPPDVTVLSESHWSSRITSGYLSDILPIPWFFLQLIQPWRRRRWSKKQYNECTHPWLVNKGSNYK